MDKLKYWLCWIAVFPGAIVAGLLATFPLHWILYFSLAKGEIISGVDMKFSMRTVLSLIGSFSGCLLQRSITKQKNNRCNTMSIFSRKYEVEIEDYCRFIYDNLFLNSANGDDSVDSILIINLEQKIGSTLCDNDRQKAIIELRALQFELFALAWTHKFIVDITVIKQSVFTKKYLLEKSMDIIWDKMNDYNDMIGAATLDWLTHLGKINISFNYNMRKDLISKNIESAKIMGFVIDESINRINNRIWSENAWRQNYIHKLLVSQFGKKLNINPKGLNREDVIHLSEIISGSYSGSQKSLKTIKIKK